MKSGKFSDALGEIDISYVEEVVNYKAASKQKRNLWKAMAACAAVILFVISIFPLLKREEEVDGFVLVAYAAENNIIVENELQVGISVPVSFFETASDAAVTPSRKLVTSKPKISSLLLNS